MLDKYLVCPNKTVKEVISYMEDNELKAVIIAGPERTLLGLFTLGDMRHYFLSGGELSTNITVAMNRTPVVFYSRSEAEAYLKTHKLVICPIIDNDKTVIDIIADVKSSSERISNSLSGVPLVIMAGGKGTRLYPYTKILPKALIPIGDYTITERIIQNFQKYGCNEIHFILNHKANMIRSYFNDIEHDYSVLYVQEKEFLGTGGGLSLLKGTIKSTFILSNCDILVNADFECLYKTHKAHKNKITFVGAMKNVVIPYGVIETDENGSIKSMKEKPGFSFLTNTGVYIIEPEVIDELVEGEVIGLPDIAQRYIDKGENVGVFPISEKAWMDMGQFSEMESMMKEFGV